MGGASVLLLGPEAEALAPRLEASGYRPLQGAVAAGLPLPDVVVLAAAAVDRIPALRAIYGSTPILLDLIVDSLEARSHCLTSGADDFWLSGQGPSDLLVRLRLHLGLRQQHQPEAVLQVADLVITPSRRQVRRGNRSVALTAREYQLLLVLMERSGQVLSRETILAKVWSDQQGAASNVIEVYVRYLRQKLEAGGERRLIHTVRGQGYSLAAKPPLQG
ncbi:MAG: response regulator transcription factor [Cyanobacteria bacterium M_surface_7_m2_040]|nr:response regulator transcription factor [Cyanobacteria bacterium M_surface_7_m2_040]